MKRKLTEKAMEKKIADVKPVIDDVKPKNDLPKIEKPRREIRPVREPVKKRIPRPALIGSGIFLGAAVVGGIAGGIAGFTPSTPVEPDNHYVISAEAALPEVGAPVETAFGTVYIDGEKTDTISTYTGHFEDGLQEFEVGDLVPEDLEYFRINMLFPLPDDVTEENFTSVTELGAVSVPGADIHDIVGPFYLGDMDMPGYENCGAMRVLLSMHEDHYVTLSIHAPRIGEEAKGSGAVVSIDGAETQTIIQWIEHDDGICYIDDESVFRKDIIYSAEVYFRLPEGKTYELWENRLKMEEGGVEADSIISFLYGPMEVSPVGEGSKAAGLGDGWAMIRVSLESISAHEGIILNAQPPVTGIIMDETKIWGSLDGEYLFMEYDWIDLEEHRKLVPTETFRENRNYKAEVYVELPGDIVSENYLDQCPIEEICVLDEGEMAYFEGIIYLGDYKGDGGNYGRIDLYFTTGDAMIHELEITATDPEAGIPLVMTGGGVWLNGRSTNVYEFRWSAKNEQGEEADISSMTEEFRAGWSYSLTIKFNLIADTEADKIHVTVPEKVTSYDGPFIGEEIWDYGHEGYNGRMTEITLHYEKLPEPEPEHQHSFNYDPARSTEATCSKGGVKVSVCECGEIQTEETPATGNHSYKLSTAAGSPATCIKNGEAYYYCEVCGDFKSETIPATGHGDYSYYPMDAVFGHNRVCGRCGYAEVEEHVFRYEHSWGNNHYAICDRCGVQTEYNCRFEGGSTCLDCGNQMVVY